MGQEESLLSCPNMECFLQVGVSSLRHCCTQLALRERLDLVFSGTIIAGLPVLTSTVTGLSAAQLLQKGTLILVAVGPHRQLSA